MLHADSKHAHYKPDDFSTEVVFTAAEHLRQFMQRFAAPSTRDLHCCGKFFSK
jgi:hypothetical protein